jgi:SAM-dependent methyltransferase
MRCKVSNKRIKPFMSFGKMPMANGFLKKKDFKKEFFYNLEVGFNKKNFLFQINDFPRPPKIFNNKYPFFTGQSKYMINHFKNYFSWLKEKKYIFEDSKCIEVGSNDGTFLKNFKTNKIDCLGFEPAKNVANFSKTKKLKVINNFFSYKNVKKNKKLYKKIDLICAANVICHIPDLNDLIKAIDYVLTENGFFIFEEPYLGSMFEKVSYDQIYDAHIYMFSAHSVREIFNEKGFELINVYPQKTHGGSMRYVISRKNKYKIKVSVNNLIKLEKKKKINKIDACLKFKKNCENSKKKFQKKIYDLKNKGYKLCGYAASAKSTTVFNYCKINHKHLDYVADSTLDKIGKFTPGSHIPIVSINYFRNNYPDIAILCSWNHKGEILNKEKQFKINGGKWIYHVKKI